MDSGDDFVVVDEESTEEKVALDRLSMLVDLFSKSLDAVNQSNILLKDELRSALSVTLQNIAPDSTSSIDALVKDLENNVTSTEEVRAQYTRRLCSRLVSVNEENQALIAELASLKESVARGQRESVGELEAASNMVGKISVLLDGIASRESTNVEQQVKFESLADLNNALSDVHERLSKIQMEQKERAEAEAPMEPIPLRDLCTQTTSHYVEASAQCDPDPVSPTTYEPVEPTPEEGEQIPEPPERSASDLQPSFCAQEEDPWCPCCCQTFSSRDELEVHLPECLQ